MYHTIIIVGNLGREPEMKYTSDGQAVVRFSVATNQRHMAANGNAFKTTIWFQISAWGKTAENCNQYLRKGRKVLVEGHLTFDPATGGPRIWIRRDGTAATSFEILANTVRFLSDRSGEVVNDLENDTTDHASDEPSDEDWDEILNG